MTSSPRQRRHHRTKQRILDVARQMVIEVGYENFSLRAVARQADYSPAGLYEYFSSKEDLLSAISMQVNDEMISAIEGFTQAAKPAEKLLAMCLGYIDFALSQPALYAMMSELPSRRKSLQDGAVEGSAYSLFLDAVEEVFQENASMGSAVFNVEEVTYGLWALVHGMASLRLSYLKEFKAEFEEANRRILQSFIHALTVPLEGEAK